MSCPSGGGASGIAPSGRLIASSRFGDADGNDAVPFRDSFSPGDEALIVRRFGKTPVARWGAAQRLYRAAGLQARFRLHPGVGHEISPEMRADIEALFHEALEAP